MPILFTSRTTEQPQYTSGGVQTALYGNVGDWVKTTINFRAFVGYENGPFDSISVNTNNEWTLSFGTWQALGFQVGQALTGEFNYSPNPTTGTNTTVDISTLGLTVLSISGGTMTVSGDLMSGAVGTSYSLPGTSTSYIFNYIKVYVEADISAIDFKYNQILNSQVTSPTLNSLLDGSITSFKVDNIVASNLVTITTIPAQSIKSGSTVKSVTIQGKGITDAFNDFEIVMIHQIEGIYDQTSDLENKAAPNWYAAADCITDVYQVKMYQTAYDESTTIQSDLNNDKLQTYSNTGWFNENFNNGVNNYSLTDVTFYDGLVDQSTGLANDGTTRITFNINGAGFDASTSQFNFGIGLAPINRANLANKAVTAFGMRCGNTMGELVSYGHSATANVISEDGFPNDVGAQIDARSEWFNVINANLVEVEIIVNVNSAFTSYVNSLGIGDQLFFMWVSVGTSGDLSTTDRVNLSFSNQIFTPEVVPITLESVNLAKFYPNQLDYYTDPTTYENEFYEFTPEDDFHFGLEFTMPLGQIINSSKVSLGIYEVSSGNLMYELDSVSAALGSSLILPDGTQEINYIDARSFNYLNTFKDNVITIQRLYSLDDGLNRGYKIIIPFRIRWEWWIANGLVPSAFFDVLEPNDNLNNEWVTKLSAAYELKQTIYLDTTDDLGNNIPYENIYGLNIKGYFDERAFTYSVETYGDELMTTDSLYISANKTNKYTADLYGILEDNPTYVKCTLSYGSFDFVNDYGEICLEIEDGQGWLSMWKIRTDQTPDVNNPLQPLAGNTTVLEVATTGEIVLKCKIDPSLLPSGSLNFKISAYFKGNYYLGDESNSYAERSLGWAKVVNDKVFNPEDREFPGECCYETLVLASTTNDEYFQNDVKGLYRETQGFGHYWTLIKCSDMSEYELTDNTYGVYMPTGSYTYEPTLTTFQLHWKKVLTLLGEGKYVIREDTSLFGRDYDPVYSCPYLLEEFSFENAANTVRIESVQNGYIEELGINFKGINFLDHLRFEGKFGYQEHSYDQTFLIDTNNNQQLNRQDLTSEYTLNTGLLPYKCITKPLFNFYLRATSLYISDYNDDNHSYDYESTPVILVNPEEEKYFARNRDAKLSIKFKERVLKRRVSTCVGDRPLSFLSDAYVFEDQCPAVGVIKADLSFIDTDDQCNIIFSASGVATFATLDNSTNIGTLTFSTDNVTFVAFSLPFTPVAGTPYYFKRTGTGNGNYLISE